MNKIFVVFFMLFLMTSMPIFAQYGGGYPNGGMNGGMGGGMGGMRNSSMNNMQNQKDRERQMKANLAKMHESQEKAMKEKLKKELTLDELQEYAINQLLSESLKKQNAILDKEGDSQDEKIFQLEAVLSKLDSDIMTLLNKNQKVTYKAMIDDRAKRLLELKNRR